MTDCNATKNGCGRPLSGYDFGVAYALNKHLLSHPVSQTSFESRSHNGRNQRNNTEIKHPVYVKRQMKNGARLLVTKA